ncbi:MAG: type I-C CRISPR-associated protein Cas7/Csd2 [Deinococcaceae bacterium]
MNIPELICNPAARHEFVLLFDATNSNPNGDPDAGNLPRVDPETMHGLVTDVALKRKIRDYVALTESAGIFIQSKTALNKLILGGFKKSGIEPPVLKLTESQFENEELISFLTSLEESGFSLETDVLTYTGESPKEIKKQMLSGFDSSKIELKRELEALIKGLEKAVKGDQKITTKQKQEAQKHMCSDYFDIRIFGAVLATGLNAGQIRGPVQLTFGKSIDPIFPMDLSLTRQARAKESDSMGLGPRKAVVPYGLYLAKGYFNPFLAKTTGVLSEDLRMLWTALCNLFEYDRSAARPEMAVRGVYIFTHENEKGNAPAHKLFESIQVQKKEDVITPRSFQDYILSISAATLPNGITLTRLLEG